METPISGGEPESESEKIQEDTYSGEVVFLYSSKVKGGVNIAGVCELLVVSEMFGLALNSNGRIYFKENGRLKSQQLDIETSISGLGMTVSGHEGFLSAGPGDTNMYSLTSAFNLLLSEKKLFNSEFGFPTESARIFMRPIAIKTEGAEDYDLYMPCVRIYSDGIISISFSSVFGFQEASVREVIYAEVNKSRRNITSVLCERAVHSACNETLISQMPLRVRVQQRRELTAIMQSSLNAPEELEFLDERLSLYELLHTNKFTLTDIARGMLSVVARAIKVGGVRTNISWFGKQYRDDSVGAYWHGKPIVCIRSHTRQEKSSAENWAVHKSFVDSVMSRVHLAEGVPNALLKYSDMRNFDDYNNFYSEPVSLLLSSAQVELSIKKGDSYTFSNLTSDIQVLNEASHFIKIYYAYASLGFDECKTAIDVARLELEVLKFEETLLSAHKYGEVAMYLEEVKRGGHLTTVYKLLTKKIETVRKALELDEKIASESYARRITIIFGIIASATLSPELMQPLAKYYGVASADEPLAKIVGIGASVIVVIGTLMFTHYIFRSFTWIARKIRM